MPWVVLLRTLGLVGLLVALSLSCTPSTQLSPPPSVSPLETLPVLYPTPAPASPVAGTVGPAELPAVVIAHGSDNIAFAPLHVAVHRGFFRAEGLDISREDADDDASLMAWLGTGQVGLVMATGGFGVAALRREIPVRVLYNTVDRNLWNVVVRADLARERGLSDQTPLGERLHALRGAIIGVTRLDGEAAHLAAYYQEQADTTAGESAHLVAAGARLALIASLESGFLDALVAMPPTIDHAMMRGQSFMLVDNSRGQDPSLVPYPMASLYASAPFAANAPNTTARVVRAIDRATQWIKASPPDEVARVLGLEYPEEDFQVLVASAKRLQGALNESGVLDPNAVVHQLKVLGAADITVDQVTAVFLDTPLRQARSPAT